MAEVVTTVGEFSDAFQHIASELKKVGVDLDLNVITTPDLIAKILNRKPWEGDAFSMQYEGYPTADISRNMNTHSCLVTELRHRDPHTCFPEFTPTVRAMVTEFDLTKRAELQRKVAQFYHEMATAIFSHERVQVDGIASNLANYSVVNRTIPYADLKFVN
jgi:ABC-type transport system substrate-binding protein